MVDNEIDLDRVVVDPDYRRLVIEYLNGADQGREIHLDPDSGFSDKEVSDNSHSLY